MGACPPALTESGRSTMLIGNSVLYPKLAVKPPRRKKLCNHGNICSVDPVAEHAVRKKPEDP